MRILKSAEFSAWYDSLTPKEQGQVESRLQRIVEHDHFGDAKDLGQGLAELRWKGGRRIYFSRTVDTEGQFVLLLLGGLKNAQSKDIQRARFLL